MNAAAALGGRVVAIALALVLSTVLFHRLGGARYAIWSFCYTLVGYLALFDFGLGPTVERLVARAQIASDTSAIGRIVNQATTLAFGIAACFWLVALLFPIEEVGGVRVTGVALVLPLCLLMSLLSAVAGSGLSGMQRMPTLNLVRGTMNALSTTALLLMVVAGERRVEILLLVHAAGLAGSALLAWSVLARASGGIRPRPFFFDTTLARAFLSFGGAVQVASFGPQLADQAFRVLLGVKFGAPFAGYYDLGSRAALVIRSFAGTLLLATVPFGAQHQVAGGAPALARLYRITLKYTALCLLPASALAFYHSRDLIALWLQGAPGSEEVLLTFRVFLAVHALAGLAAPISMVARAAGWPGPEACMLSVASAAGLVLAGLMRGPAATLTAFGGASVFAAFALWALLSRRLAGPTGPALDVLRVAAIAAAALLVSYLLGRFDWAGTPGGTMARVLVQGGVGLAAALGLAWPAGLLDPVERRFWRSLGRVAAPNREAGSGR